jgi:hypothetical protein
MAEYEKRDKQGRRKKSLQQIIEGTKTVNSLSGLMAEFGGVAAIRPPPDQ